MHACVKSGSMENSADEAHRDQSHAHGAGSSREVSLGTGSGYSVGDEEGLGAAMAHMESMFDLMRQDQAAVSGVDGAMLDVLALLSGAR